MDALLCRADIYRLTGLSESKITCDLRAGHLAPPVIKGWHARWTQDAVDAYIAFRRIPRPRIKKLPNELTRQQVARKLGISLAHFHRLVRTGQVPSPCRKVGIRPLYDRDAIATFIASRNQPDPVDELRPSQVIALTRLSRSAIQRLRAAGKFPEPDQLYGNRPRWNADSIFEYIAKHPPKYDPSHSAIIDAAGQVVTHARFGWIPDSDTDALSITGRTYLVVGHRTGRPSSIRVQRIDEIPPTVRTLWNVTPNATAQPTYRDQGFKSV